MQQVNFSKLNQFQQWALSRLVTDWEQENGNAIPDLTKRLDIEITINGVEVDIVAFIASLESLCDSFIQDGIQDCKQEMQEVRNSHITMHKLAQLYSQMQQLKKDGEWESDE